MTFSGVSEDKFEALAFWRCGGFESVTESAERSVLRSSARNEKL
jgi:hypothetical protein